MSTGTHGGLVPGPAKSLTQPLRQVPSPVIFFFNSVLRPFQDFFSSYETGQSVGGPKTGEPREKPPDTTASRTWFVSQVARAGLEPIPDTAVRSSSD